jgi:hypothetical protein
MARRRPHATVLASVSTIVSTRPSAEISRSAIEPISSLSMSMDTQFARIDINKLTVGDDGLLVVGQLVALEAAHSVGGYDRVGQFDSDDAVTFDDDAAHRARFGCRIESNRVRPRSITSLSILVLSIIVLRSVDVRPDGRSCETSFRVGCLHSGYKSDTLSSSRRLTLDEK